MSRDEPPTTKRARARLLGGVAVSSGVARVRYAVRSLSTSGPDELAKERDAEIARKVFAALGQLRGAALKISQMLSTEEDLLPDAFREELARASYRAPPLNRAVVRRIIRTELGAPPERVFSSIDMMPFAAASLGQVHRAEAAGQPGVLAVKVQYPGMAAAISSDMTIVRSMLRAANQVGGEGGLQSMMPLLDEIERRLFEEVDYRKEAEATRFFKGGLASLDVEVPEVVSEFSGGRVLTTSLIPGQHIDQWLLTDPTAAERSRVARSLAQVFFHCAFGLGRVQADPNFGNYLVLPDGRLGLIDFGCSEQVTPTSAAFLGLTMRAYIDNDLDTVIAEHQRLGMLAVDLSPARRADLHARMKLSHEWVADVLGPATTDFAALPDLMKRVRDSGMSLGPALDKPVRGLLFAGRAFNGLVRMLSKIRAQVSLRDLLPPAEGFDPQRHRGLDG